jgi:predicted ribonuclease YlaK
VTDWVQKEYTWDVPESVEEAKAVFSRRIQSFVKLLQILESPKQRRIIVVPDTNALISCSDFANYQRVAGQPDFTLVIMPTVLSELDQLKVTARDNGFREKVKSIITRIKGLRVQGSLIEGVIINKTVTVRMEAREPDFGHTLSWLDSGNNDDRIVASILEMQREEPSAVVILSTGDINLQNKAEMAHIPFVEPPDT